jgi:hypothetical protein
MTNLNDLVHLGAHYVQGPPPQDDDDDSECVDGYPEHDLRLIEERDGYTTYECRRCGAEVVSEPDEEG